MQVLCLHGLNMCVPVSVPLSSAVLDALCWCTGTLSYSVLCTVLTLQGEPLYD